ncbi:MAG: twin-arginine translocation signal domain-containing protein [Cytophagales bacterium]|nr:MAG: twin-arginine translocation signal domain-containing protein [Cytophagales bacterium]
MNRRQFLQQSTAGAAALALPDLRAFGQESRMGVVVHSYAHRWMGKTPSTRFPGFTNALDLLEHCHKINAGGIQTVVNNWSEDFAHSVRDRREKLGMYLEGSIGMPKKPDDVATFERDVLRAKEAGARILRTVCSGGRRYEILHAQAEFDQMRKAALTSLQLAEPVLRKHGVRLAVENHKDWRATELVEMLKSISSEWIGATIDFGNNMALLEDPTHVVQTLAPYAVSTHVKDMAVERYADGFLLSEVPLGQGVLNLPDLFATCRKANPTVTFNLEMITRDPLEIPCLKPDYWSTMGTVPGSDLANILRYLDRKGQPNPLPRMAGLNPEQKLAIEEQNILTCLAYK